MNKTELIALEKELAEALGWTDFRPVTFCGDACSYRAIPPGETMNDAVPQYTRKWEACGPLMTEYACWPLSHRLSDSVVVDDQLEYIDEHKNKDTAVRVAVCRAVLAKLKEAR